MAREPITFTKTNDLPASARASGGVGRTSPYDALVAEVNANPGQWYEVPCKSDNQAYSRATTMRKSYGLEAHARNATVYVRSNGETSAAEPSASPSAPVAS